MVGPTPLKELLQDIYSISSLHNAAIVDFLSEQGWNIFPIGNLNDWEVQRTCDLLTLLINIFLDR